MNRPQDKASVATGGNSVTSLRTAKTFIDEGALVALKPSAGPREIADAVVFLTANQSCSIVGAELAAGGGLTQL
jgi:hypothetical protein|tara:strand:- start:5692 stop:5913 length:222 start_codon:yes stop_codon:yes gene_type:complete